MEQFKLLNNFGRKWYPFTNGFVKGFAFIGDIFLSEKDIYEKCLVSITNNTLDELLKELNGNYCAVIYINDKYYLIVDKLRSFALFYTFDCNQKLEIITDVGQEAVELTKTKKRFNNITINEMLSKGYLSGNKTLFEDIFQVEAGTYILINESQIKINKYHNFIKNKQDYQKSEIFDKAKSALENGFSRIITSIGKDRPILIPLSGGYDSRLVACLCKTFNIKDVTCFTYGRNTSLEMKTSKIVAEKLGFKWLYVEYDEYEWNKYLNSENYKKYAIYAGNITSIPHIQDAIAIQTLINKNLISTDSVVMPGHCGDLLGGSKIPKIIKEKRNVILNKDLLINLIYNNNYNLNILKNHIKKNCCKIFKLKLMNMNFLRMFF